MIAFEQSLVIAAQTKRFIVTAMQNAQSNELVSLYFSSSSFKLFSGLRCFNCSNPTRGHFVVQLGFLQLLKAHEITSISDARLKGLNKRVAFTANSMTTR